MSTLSWDERHFGVFSDVFFLVMRRMRFPLLLIIVAFSLSTAGFALIPGADEYGNRTDPMSPFDAFYVVVYTGTTLGLGEIPQPFSTAQRMWMVVTVIVTVASWTYSLFAIIGMLQDKAFSETLRSARFARQVRSIREPFYIVCGAGETGVLVMQGLDHLNLRFVVIEKEESRVSRMVLEEFAGEAPMRSADAAQPSVLVSAGLLSPYCRGVVALAEEDVTNQAIAVTVRLLAPKVAVLARIRDTETETHLGVFGGDLVINPFERFSGNLAAAISTPERYRLRTTLTGLPGDPIGRVHHPPQGHWIVCGYGRFGREMTESLRAAGVTVTVIDHQFYQEGGVDVDGTGSNSEDLLAAGLDHAVGLVAANGSDTKNLAIGVTARSLRHDLFIVARQNVPANAPLFEAFATNVVMEPSRIVAQEFLARITTPLLSRFLRYVPQLSEANCRQLTEVLASLDEGRIPEVWDLMISNRRTPAVFETMQRGQAFRVRHLVTDPHDRSKMLDAMVLLVRRGNSNELLPDYDYELQSGDRVLIASSPHAMYEAELALRNINFLQYIQTGEQSQTGWLWSKLVRTTAKRKARPAKGFDLPDLTVDVEEDLATEDLDVVADDEPKPAGEPADEAEPTIEQSVVEDVPATDAPEDSDEPINDSDNIQPSGDDDDQVSKGANNEETATK